MMPLTHFKNIYDADEHIIVCGTGASLELASQQWLDKSITIGTNDIARFRKVDYTVYPDAWWITEQLSGPEMAAIKKHHILNFTSNNLFLVANNNLGQEHGLSIIQDFSRSQQKKIVLCDTLFMKVAKDEQYLQLLDARGTITRGNTLISSYATHMAFSLAYYMGSRDIGFVGFDFSPKYAHDNDNKIYQSKCVGPQHGQLINNFNKIFFGLFPDVRITNYSPNSLALEGICEYRAIS